MNLCNFMKKSDLKVSRKRISWFDILVKQHNEDLKAHFNKLYLRSYNRKGKKRLSLNRCAYNALRSYYSTTTIADLERKLGL